MTNNPYSSQRGNFRKNNLSPDTQMPTMPPPTAATNNHYLPNALGIQEISVCLLHAYLFLILILIDALTLSIESKFGDSTSSA